MPVVRVTVLVPKAEATADQRAAARKLQDDTLARLPVLLGTQFFRVEDDVLPRRWPTFGVSITIWDNEGHANSANAALNATHNDLTFKAAIKDARPLEPPFPL